MCIGSLSSFSYKIYKINITCLSDSKITLDCPISFSAATIQNLIFHLTWHQNLCIPEFSYISSPLYYIMQGWHRDTSPSPFTYVHVHTRARTRAHTHTQLRRAIHHYIKSGSHCICICILNQYVQQNFITCCMMIICSYTINDFLRNYPGIAPSAMHNILCNIIQSSLTPYEDEIVCDDQCGF